MATDKLFYEYAMLFPNAMARFVEAEPDDYEAKSLTFKQIERRADIFLIGRSGQHVVLVEPQGYGNKELYYDMLIKVALFCKQNKYRGKIDAIVLFLNESHFQAAEEFNQQFENSTLVRFTPKVFVFSCIKIENLSQFNDAHLIPLYPFCDISSQEIEAQAGEWAEKIKKAPELETDERINLLTQVYH